MTASVPAVPSAGPAESTSFVGRRPELAEIRRLLSESRLVTVTGPGGVGKTRLVVQAVGQLRRAYPDGVWLVELADVRDARLLVQTVAGAIGLREQPGRPPLAMLTEFLRGRRALLVLDNCEHLLDPCAALAEGLLRACPDLQILDTSREPLSMLGEAVLAVPPLSVPDPGHLPSPRELCTRYEAVSLFTARATALLRGFAITDQNHAAVAEICRQLDGLPLAIELAAVWLRTLSPQGILDRLVDRFRLLSWSAATVPRRQQTLRATFDWSFELCDPAERLLWARLAVFDGGFDLAAAEGVCVDDQLPLDAVLDAVAGLVDKAVLARQEDRFGLRYRMLETVRQYAAEKLHSSGEHPALRRRHRDWYEQLVCRADAEWISPRQQYWLIRLGDEHPNVRAALEQSLAAGDVENALRILVTPWRIYWWAHGLVSEGRQWADRVLKQASDPTALHARGRLLASHLAVYQGEYNLGREYLEQGRALTQHSRDPVALSYAGFAAGMHAIYTDDLPGAVAAMQEGLTTAATLPDPSWRLDMMLPLAVAYDLLGRRDEAVALHEQTLALTEPHGEIFHRSYSLWALGITAWQRGDLDGAAELERQALGFKRAVDDRLGAAFCLETLAAIAADLSRHERAAGLLGAAEVLWRHTGSSPASAQHLAAFHEECVRQTTNALGPHAYQAAFDRGAGLTVDEAISFGLEERLQPPPAPARAPLTRRERQVADLVGQGLTNADIAKRLVISQRTAETHVEHILTKLGLTSRAQVAAWAARQRQTDH